MLLDIGCPRPRGPTVYGIVTENPNVSDLGMFHPTFGAKAAPKMVAEFPEKTQKIWEGQK